MSGTKSIGNLIDEIGLDDGAGEPNGAQKALRPKGLSFIIHPSSYGARPELTALILARGYEAYGRYWRLAEMVAGGKTCGISYESACASKVFMGVLGFETLEELKGFIDALIEYGAASIDSSGDLDIPPVSESSSRIEDRRAGASKAGKASAKARAAKARGKERQG